MTAVIEQTWFPVCAPGSLQPDHGVAALLPEGTQVAVFRTHEGTLHALSNKDPFSGAMVLSRGIVGDKAGRPVVCSPMHKQAFDLRTGECLEDAARSVAVFPIRESNGVIEVGLP
jgi:nitrite reductase (NADH) small subunit